MPGALRVSVDGVHVTRETEGSHLLANARIAYRWRGLSLTVDVLNLTDAEYRDPSAQPAAGRAVYVTGQWGGQ
jgi:outer membrane receptor protein involved in Fe transport